MAILPEPHRSDRGRTGASGFVAASMGALAVVEFFRAIWAIMLAVSASAIEE
jgi:hypothetical protein